MNETLKWIENNMKDKIWVSKDIIDQKQNRGIYGIFVVECISGEEYCAYVGKATNIYSRMFCGKNAHLVKLKNHNLNNEVINSAIKESGKRIEVRVLASVTFEYKNYNKDMQKLASAECHYIDKYQALNQCLEQRPDGRNMYLKFWNEECREMEEKK